MMGAAPILPPTTSNIAKAADLLLSGGVVAYPTETVYGLGVDPFNEQALAKLFKIKGRPSDQPVLLLIADRADTNRLASDISPVASALMDRFWPGPLTLVLPARGELSHYVTSGSGTVAIRLASPGTAADLLVQAGTPVTSTSANRSGASPATTSEQAAELLTETNTLVLDGHCSTDALPSTIVDTTSDIPRIIRSGAIPDESVLA